MQLEYGARTDIGQTRNHNEDTFGIGEDAPADQLGRLFIVCDGMGGHAAGEVASALAVETILARYYADATTDRVAALRAAFEHANQQIFTQGRGSMGTTGVAALLYRDELIAANVGDSRIYLVRDGSIRRVSRDHSLIEEQVAAGLVTSEQARTLNYRNVITRALGYQPEVQADLFRLPLQVDDLIVLSSDGLHGLVEDQLLLDTVAHLEPDPAAVRLIDLANERGGTDNITAVIIHIRALEWHETDGGDKPSDREHGTIDVIDLDRPAITAALTDAELGIAPAAPVPATPLATPAGRQLSLAGALLTIVALLALGAMMFVTLLQPLPPAATAVTDALLPVTLAPATLVPPTVTP